MKDLINSVNIVRKYNKMSIDDFIDEYEKFYKEPISKEQREYFKFTGLNNVDFLKSRRKV